MLDDDDDDDDDDDEFNFFLHVMHSLYTFGILFLVRVQLAKNVSMVHGLFCKSISFTL